MNDSSTERSDNVERKITSSSEVNNSGVSPGDESLNALRHTIGRLPTGSFTGNDLVLILAILRKEETPLLSKKTLAGLIGRVQLVESQIDQLKHMQKSLR